MCQHKFEQEYVRKNDEIRLNRWSNPFNPLFKIPPELGLKAHKIACGDDFSLVLQSGHLFMLGNSYYDI